MIHYTPPKQLRALFIIHYAPLLLIILTGPILTIYRKWLLSFPELITRLIGLCIFIVGAIIYLQWELFWNKTYNGQLVTEGIFQHIRHPHYTTLLIMGLGLGIFFYSPVTISIAIIAIPIMIWSILDEEKLLLKQYGKQYQQYMKDVPWRLIPRLY